MIEARQILKAIASGDIQSARQGGKIVITINSNPVLTFQVDPVAAMVITRKTILCVGSDDFHETIKADSPEDAEMIADAIDRLLNSAE